MLVLFDIDGTLLLDDAYAHGRAMVRAMREVWRVDLDGAVVERIEPWGKTDMRIAREAMETAGIQGSAFEERLGAWMDAASRAFEEEVVASAGGWRVREGLAAGMQELAARGLRLSLLTGNLRPIAVAKVRQMGLDAYLDFDSGAYGGDAEERSELVAIARRRAGSGGDLWPRGRTVIVGDTPGDVAAARAARVPALVFASARFPARSLEGADVVADVADLVEKLLRLPGGGP